MQGRWTALPACSRHSKHVQQACKAAGLVVQSKVASQVEASSHS